MSDTKSEQAPCDDPRTDRGEIVEITMKVQYPDGSSKSVTYDADWCFETGAILMAESCMTEEQRAQFHKGDDWMENPTFLKWERGHKRCGSSCVGGGQCVDCCACTSCPA